MSESLDQFLRDRAKPRCAHYAMAHYVLRLAALNNPLPVMAILASPDAPRFLSDLLQRCIDDCRERKEPDPDFTVVDFKVHPRRLGDFPVAVVEFPKPIAITEAHMVAIVFMARPDLPPEQLKQVPVRYFTLEMGSRFRKGNDRTVICEWTTTAHFNGGDGPAATVEAFCDAIKTRLTPAA